MGTWKATVPSGSGTLAAFQAATAPVAGASPTSGASSWKCLRAASLNDATMTPSMRPIRFSSAASSSALRMNESTSESAAPLISMLIGMSGWVRITSSSVGIRKSSARKPAGGCLAPVRTPRNTYADSGSPGFVPSPGTKS